MFTLLLPPSILLVCNSMHQAIKLNSNSVVIVHFSPNIIFSLIWISSHFWFQAEGFYCGGLSNNTKTNFIVSAIHLSLADCMTSSSIWLNTKCWADGCDSNPKICDYTDEIEVYSNLTEAALEEFDSNFTSYQIKYFYTRDSIYKFVTSLFVFR